MAKKLGFLLLTGTESAIPAMFFKFLIDHKKRLFSKKIQENPSTGKREI